MGISPLQGIGAQPPSRAPAQLDGTATSTARQNRLSAMLAGSRSEAAIPALLQIDVAVTQLLDALGGDVEEHATLRIVIALLILLTLLASLQESGSQVSSQARGSGGSSFELQTMGFYASGTSFSFERTTTSIAQSSIQSASTGNYASGGASHGGRIDLAG